MQADAMTDAVLGAAAAAHEEECDRAEAQAELEQAAKDAAVSELMRTAASFAWALDQDGANDVIGCEPVKQDRLIEVAGDPWHTSVTLRELVCVLMFGCANERMPTVVAALRAKVIEANKSELELRRAELLREGAL